MADFGKLAFGIRVGHAVDPSFFWCWTMLLRSGKMRDGDCVLNPAVGLPHAPACTILLGWFLQSGADALMLLDDDMEFTPDAVERLRSDDFGFDVMSALYVTRKRPHVPIVVTGYDDATSRPKLANFASIKGIMPVDYVGFGMTIVKRKILEDLQALYPGQSPFAFDAQRGEDGRFCDDVRRVGGRIGLNTDVRIGHRTSVALYWNKEARDLEFSENDYGLGLARDERKTQQEK